MRAKYSEATVVEDSSGAAAEQTYDDLRALFQYLPPGDTVDSFSITIDVTMKPVVVRREGSLTPATRRTDTPTITEDTA